MSNWQIIENSCNEPVTDFFELVSDLLVEFNLYLIHSIGIRSGFN